MLIQQGTVSHGTLRTPDLLRAFADELERAAANHPLFDADLIHLLIEARAAADAADDGETLEDVSEIIHELIDALNRLSPDGMYFGAHEGDGSDFGWWSIYDAEE